jgi:hypothetical protein
VYRRPNEAFGPNVWKREVQPDEIEESRRIHDDFYAALSTHLDRLAADGRFLVLDVHSYNHRRRGRSRALPTGYACLTVAAASAHDRHALPAGDGAIHLFRRRFGAGRTERLARAGSCSGGLADKWL